MFKNERYFGSDKTEGECAESNVAGKKRMGEKRMGLFHL